jgi:hypothetical protein
VGAAAMAVVLIAASLVILLAISYFGRPEESR